MLTALAEDWVEGAFLGRRSGARSSSISKARPCRYDELLATRAGRRGGAHRAAALRQRHANVQAAIARLRDDIAAAKLDALIIIGDDQEELFDHSNMPAIGVYYGETIANAQAAVGERPAGPGAACGFTKTDGERDYPCHAALARHLIDALQHDGFDLSAMAKTAPGKFEGHAISFVHRFLMGRCRCRSCRCS